MKNQDNYDDSIYLHLLLFFICASFILTNSETSNRQGTEPVFKEDMVFIKGGTFLMGTNNGSEYARPAHKVTVSDFYLSRNEVTVGEYLAFVKATGKHHPEWLEPGSSENIHTGHEDHYKRLGASLTNPSHPVMGVG